MVHTQIVSALTHTDFRHAWAIDIDIDVKTQRPTNEEANEALPLSDCQDNVIWLKWALLDRKDNRRLTYESCYRNMSFMLDGVAIDR